jgi:hypothetical protein
LALMPMTDWRGQADTTLSDFTMDSRFQEYRAHRAICERW